MRNSHRQPAYPKIPRMDRRPTAAKLTPISTKYTSEKVARNGYVGENTHSVETTTRTSIVEWEAATIRKAIHLTRSLWKKHELTYSCAGIPVTEVQNRVPYAHVSLQFLAPG